MKPVDPILSPSIPPAADTSPPRPFWSVMIPTYQPSEVYLRAAIDSVLAQDPGPDQMQIAVVDDCSPDADVAAMVEKLGRGRVSFSRNPRNLGLAGGWNSCVAHARGEWVHLLHQDDLLQPGFYAELRRLITECPTAGAAFTRLFFLDEHSAWTHLSPIESHERGLLPDWQYRLTTGPRVQCASIVVRRSVYENLGGFRTDIPYCLDWEMWGRISVAYPFAHSPAILAGYRSHAGSQTSRLSRDVTCVTDQIATFSLLASRLPPERGESAAQPFTHYILPELMRNVVSCYVGKHYDAALKLVACAAALPVPKIERAELNRIARNSKLKRWSAKSRKASRPS
jgi:glycosyltransferase involved in cell wall biosynthesis